MSQNGPKKDYTDIRHIAYRLWEKRGRAAGPADDDRFRAEQPPRENSATPPAAPPAGTIAR